MLKRSLIAAAGIVALAAVATAATELLFIERTVAKFRNVDTGNELEPVLSGKPQTILLAGSDRRHGDKKLGIRPRSDTIMLMRIDPGKGIALMSIPRDLKAEIPGHGTSKINDAYTLGGPKLMIKTVKQLTGLRVNHYIDVNFLGFQKAVNAIGCVYIDVDRRYFNDNSGSPYGGGYAVINVKSGYQKLCGMRALEYARYRHTDTDIVRNARQQDFLRQVRDQLSTGKLISKTNKLIDIFAKNTATDIESAGALRRVLRLALGVLDQPITQVKWHGELGPSYINSSDAQVKASVRQFLFARGKGALAEEKRKTPVARKRGKSKSSGANLADYAQSGKEQGRLAYDGTGFDPVFYPTKLVSGSSFTDAPRTYSIKGRDGKRHRAYKMVIDTGLLGQYYGLMGTSWEDPPILASPSETRKIGGREYMLFYNGDRLRLLAWRDKGKAYWLSNTLLLSLSAKEMLGIARSMKRYRG